MKLYLARHGEYTMNLAQQLDMLTEKGTQDIKRLASLLNQAQITVSTILHSGKYRAQQTAELLALGVKCGQSVQSKIGLQPNDDVAAFANEIAHWGNDVLVVGHLPFMGRLVSKLLIGNENKELVDFQPGTLICMETTDNERWVIHWVVRPGLINCDLGVG